MKTLLIIKVDIEGFHNYPNPPKEVEFLKYNHRHIFKIKCEYLVAELNREKEFFILREKIQQYFKKTFGSPCEFGAMSCEMIAFNVLDYYSNNGMISCEVWEENTGGAKIEL